MISQHTPQQAPDTFPACPGHPILLYSSVLSPTIPPDSAASMSTQVIPTELSTMNPDHHHSTPAAATPMPQLTSPPSARNLIVALHYSPDYLPPSPSTIPVESFSPLLSLLLSNMPPIHSLSSVTSSLPVSQSNQPSPGQEFQVLLLELQPRLRTLQLFSLW